MKRLTHLFMGPAFCCLLSAPAAVQAQRVEHSTEQSDFQVRTGISFDKKVIDGLHLTWSEELRLKNSLGDIDRIYSVIAASYDIFPWLKAGADYTFIAVKQQKGWEFRNRSNIDITVCCKPGARLKLSLRERFRVTSANKSHDPHTESNPAWVMRSRLMAEYGIGRLPLKPYAYFELSNTLNAPGLISNYADKIRCSAGVKYAPCKRSEFDFFYRFDHNRSKDITLPTAGGMPLVVTTNKQNNHILGIFYEYSF